MCTEVILFKVQILMAFNFRVFFVLSYHNTLCTCLLFVFFPDNFDEGINVGFDPHSDSQQFNKYYIERKLQEAF